MKIFEHEVLTFDVSTKKGFSAMQNTLREWGLAGFEVVSVLQTNSTTPIAVFLKREMAGAASSKGKAA